MSLVQTSATGGGFVKTADKTNRHKRHRVHPKGVAARKTEENGIPGGGSKMAGSPAFSWRWRLWRMEGGKRATCSLLTGPPQSQSAPDETHAEAPKTRGETLEVCPASTAAGASRRQLLPEPSGFPRPFGLTSGLRPDTLKGFR